MTHLHFLKDRDEINRKLPDRFQSYLKDSAETDKMLCVWIN